ncbi:unnamed protein product, partial [Hydatigera taeniaeformis]|uniref:Nudix hydrolase domain-containing protein n=1 Tax=Hydatigena taeniaeformis TaxID=6205 RepID=A0A0R3WRW7_HYDTA
QKGVEEGRASFLVAAIGIGNTLGRVVFGALAMTRRVRIRLHLYNSSLVICGLITTISCWAVEYPLMLTYNLAFGFFSGSYVTLFSVLLVDLLGIEFLKDSFGLSLLIMGVAVIVGPPIAGAYYNVTVKTLATPLDQVKTSLVQAIELKSMCGTSFTLVIAFPTVVRLTIELHEEGLHYVSPPHDWLKLDASAGLSLVNAEAASSGQSSFPPLNGVNRFWDGVKAHNGVSILIYNKDRESFVFVKQFRPVVFYALLRNLEGENVTDVDAVPHTPIGADGKPIHLSSSKGETLELCAGIVDKADATLEETAVGEIHEECGYRVNPSRLRKVTTGW